jgi:prepilin-type processing-associated H-X9-DG protein
MISMKLTQQANQPSGLTIIEVLLVLVILCLLVFLLLPHRRINKRLIMAESECQAKLKMVTLAEIVWANDNEAANTFAAYRSTNYGGFRELLLPLGLAQFYRSLSNELINPRILTCPSDTHKPTEDFESLTTNNLSYFLNMDVRSDTRETGVFSNTGLPSEPNETEVLHGDRHIVFTSVTRQQPLLITSNLPAHWDRSKGHITVGNISFADGSVRRVTDRELSEWLKNSASQSPQRLLFP